MVCAGFGTNAKRTRAAGRAVFAHRQRPSVRRECEEGCRGMAQRTASLAMVPLAKTCSLSDVVSDFSMPRGA